MRRWIVIFSVIVGSALVAIVGYFTGWWRPTRSTISETATAYDADSQPATLQEVLVTAHQALDEIEHNVRDYSAVIVKQERVGKQLVKTVMFAKIREKPFSVYLNFLRGTSMTRTTRRASRAAKCSMSRAAMTTSC